MQKPLLQKLQIEIDFWGAQVLVIGYHIRVLKWNQGCKQLEPISTLGGPAPQASHSGWRL